MSYAFVCAVLWLVFIVQAARLYTRWQEATEVLREWQRPEAIEAMRIRRTPPTAADRKTARQLWEEARRDTARTRIPRVSS